MEQREALALLDQVRETRRRTKAQVGGLWFPLILFGGLSLLSTPLNGPSLGVYWAVAAPIGVALNAAFYCRRERAVGIESRLGPIIVATAVIVVGTAVTGSVGGALGAEMVAAAGPTFAVSIGLAMFARITHSDHLAALALGMATLAGALVIFGVAAAATASILAAGTGAASMLVGLLLLRLERQ